MADLPSFDLDDRVLAVAANAAGRELCPECFGRVFGRLGHGLTNPERAARLREKLGQSYSTAPTALCSVCGGLFDRLPTWVERALRAADGFEFLAAGSQKARQAPDERVARQGLNPA